MLLFCYFTTYVSLIIEVSSQRQTNKFLLLSFFSIFLSFCCCCFEVSFVSSTSHLVLVHVEVVHARFFELTIPLLEHGLSNHLLHLVVSRIVHVLHEAHDAVRWVLFSVLFVFLLLVRELGPVVVAVLAL